MAAPTHETTKKPLRIGVFLEEVQMSDITGLDLFGAHTPEIIAVNVNIEPRFKPLLALATPMEFLYISSSLNNTFVSPSVGITPTHTYANAPRDLDVLLIGGPDPATVKPESLAFLKEASLQTKAILTTCSGGLWLAKSGVLDGKKATTNRAILERAKNDAPNVEWLDQKWVVEKGHFDGAEIWTGGGAGAGIEMLMEYTATHYNLLLTKIACWGLDFSFENRSQFYSGPLVFPF